MAAFEAAGALNLVSAPLAAFKGCHATTKGEVKVAR